jgi:hypothetical protein
MPSPDAKLHVLFSVVCALLLGCTRTLPNGGQGNPDAGSGDLCTTHMDTASCEADASCRAITCPSTCGTGSTFVTCQDKNRPVPPIACPLAGNCFDCRSLDQTACTTAAQQGRCIVGACCGSFLGCLNPGDSQPSCLCANCQGLDEAHCKARGTSCRADYCLGCSTTPQYVQCSNPNDRPLECDPPPCPPPLPCKQLMSETDCNGRSDCHSVYHDPGTCFAPGCEVFEYCADGKADCKGPAACNIVPPVCNPPYTLGYTGACYEGCVLQTACQ